MYCQKCKGNVYYDSSVGDGSSIDLACLHCGKRWFVDALNPLARLVLHARS